MGERMLDKSKEPSLDDIKNYLGKESFQFLLDFESGLSKRYNLVRNLKFPFGNDYGWGFQFMHRKTHLCYAFFERGAFTVMLQLGDDAADKMKILLPQLSNKAKELWEMRYPCGREKLGGWIHYQITTQIEVLEIIRLIELKKKVVSHI